MDEREFIVPAEDIGVDGAYFGYVEVIRRKDCLHYQKWIKGMYCTVHDWYTKKTDYCSRAEKK